MIHACDPLASPTHTWRSRPYLTPTFPHSMRQTECGAPRSSRVTRSTRRALMSTYTTDGSGCCGPCVCVCVVHYPSERRTDNMQCTCKWSTCVCVCVCVCVHLEADDRIDPAAKGGGDSMGSKAEWTEEGRERAQERLSGPLLAHHHTRPHT